MPGPDTVELAAELVAAFVSSNPLPKSELPGLIHAVYEAIEGLARGSTSAPPQVEAREPAVPVRKSITAEFLICLEDGKKFKSLRRHLTQLGLTPDQYRAKWNLRPTIRWSRRTTLPSDPPWRCTIWRNWTSIPRPPGSRR